MNWKDNINFGKYKGCELLATWIKDKNYFKWCIENEVNQPEIEFIKNEITEAEKRQIKLGFSQGQYVDDDEFLSERQYSDWGSGY